MRIAILLLLLTIGGITCAQDIAGRWITIDDKSGKKRSVVKVTMTN